MQKNISKSRTAYAARNAVVSVLMQAGRIIVGFVSRTIFIKVLGAEYLGVNGLFTDILTVLSFAELGIGEAITFSLYRPLALNNTEKIKSLMALYEKLYKIIGILIFVIGVCLIPFLKQIVGDVSNVKENLILLYLLFLFNTASSYFFSYKITLIIANQMNYIVDTYRQVFYIILVVSQSVVLVTTKKYIFYLIVQILFTFAENLTLSRKANKIFPYLKEKNIKKLNNTDISEIKGNVKALVVYKFGSMIIDGTDSIFISSLVNVATVGLYSNYKLIINIVQNVGVKVMNAIIASVGNLNATADKKSKEKVFYEIMFIDAWYFGLSTVGLCLLLSKFIVLWIGNNYLIDYHAVIAACIYFYISCMHYACFTYRQTAGLFRYGQFAPLAGAAINVVLDITLGIKFGLSGIIWASIICRSFTYEIIDPLIIYQRVFDSDIKKYIVRYFKYASITAASALICFSINRNIHITGILGFIINFFVIIIVFNVIFILSTFNSEEFQSMKRRALLLGIRKL